MRTIGYLYLHTLKNRIRKALRHPVTYIYLLIIVMYIFLIPTSFRMMAENFRIDSPGGMAGVMTVVAFWLVPGNLIAYAKRKGLVYRNGDVHFLFSSPVRPKLVLLYAHMKGLIASVLLNLFVIFCGKAIFQVEGWRLALYFCFTVIVENVLEGGIMLLLYGSERMSETQRGLVVKAAYALAGILALIGGSVFLREGLSLTSVLHFLNGDAVQMVPVVGWYIAVIHLIFTGPTAVNIAGTALYSLLFAAVLLMAFRMKCTGAFYEDAIKFAEDYEEVLESRRQGNTDKRMGKRRRFKKARAVWKGQGAQALFYRQLLEYKKNKYFIFDMNTVFAAAGGIFIVWIYRQGELGAFQNFIIPAVSAYLIFIFTSLSTKWSKELQSPYTYMLPDSPWKKLWYATAMQHVQNFVNACLIALPGAVAMKLDPAVALLCLVFYMLLAANKLYALAVAEAAMGGTLGKVGKQFFQLFAQGLAIMAAVLGGALGMAAGGIVLAYVLLDVLLALVTFVFMVLSVLNFYRMETV